MTARDSIKLPLGDLSEADLERYEQRASGSDFTIRKLADIQSIDGIDVLRMVREIRRRRAEGAPDIVPWCPECGIYLNQSDLDGERHEKCKSLVDWRDVKATEQASGRVTAKEAEAGAYYEEKSYVELAVLSSLIIQWRARAKRLLEEQPYPGFAGEAEQLDRLAAELERACG